MVYQCISYLVVEALGFEGHHERFRNVCKVEASSWGVQEHYQLSMIAKHALQTDQLDGYNNLFLEIVFRRLQISNTHMQNVLERWRRRQ